MLRWANRRSYAHVSVVKEERRLWLDACIQSFLSPFASKARGDASVSEFKVLRQHAHAHFSAGGDATISVCNAGRQDVGVGENRALACSHQDAKGHSVDGAAKVFESATCTPDAKTHFGHRDARVTESAVCGQIQNLDLCSPSIWDSLSDLEPNDKYDVSNVSGKTQSPHASLQTLVIKTQKKARKALSDLQQKVELLEAEQFSYSDAAKLVKERAFKSCSFEQLSAVLQVLKELFPSAKVVHDIVVLSPSILMQSPELVQQKLKLLYDFQVEEKVISRLCSRGRVLSISVESLQKKLMFYKDIGLTVQARNMMLFRGPLILLLSIEKSIQPALDFLESIGLTRESIWNLGRSCPELFYMSLDHNLIKKYEYLRQLGLSAKEFPRAFRCVRRFSIQNIEDRLQSFKDLGFTDDNLRLMLKRQPSILSCSPENIKCKVDFLICEQNRDIADIVKDPFCLTYSLQGRIVPRFNFIKELGNSKVYSLSSILDSTESKFMKRFGK